MAVLLPYIGVTECSRALSLLRNYIDNIVGTFWVMNGYGFDDFQLPGWWIDLVLQENQAQAILDLEQQGAFSQGHDKPIYVGFCIIVVADKANPANLSYVIQHVRMIQTEGIELLKILAKHNIPAHTEVTYPLNFLENRYGDSAIPPVLKKIDHWNVQLWEDYCSYLMAEHGGSMIFRYWSKSH